MQGIKDVMDYSKLNYFEVLDLPLDVFMLMKKRHFIDECNKTEEGKKYLADCERLTKTEIEYDKLKQQFGRSETT